jgi:hypothetical protein
MATVLCRLPRGCILQSAHPPQAAFDGVGHAPPQHQVLELNHGVNDKVPLALIELWAKKSDIGLEFTKLGEDSSGPVYVLKRSAAGILHAALMSKAVISAR